MTAQWFADRLRLYALLHTHPDWAFGGRFFMEPPHRWRVGAATGRGSGALGAAAAVR